MIKKNIINDRIIQYLKPFYAGYKPDKISKLRDGVISSQND